MRRYITSLKLTYPYQDYCFSWGGDAVVFNPLSGDTFQLTSEGHTLLSSLSHEEPVSFDLLCERVGISCNPAAQSNLEKLLASLAAKELVVISGCERERC